METLFLLAVATVVIVLVFDYTNGFHDAANIVATVIASRAMTPAQAVIIVGVFEFLGPLLGGTAVANTIGKFITLDGVAPVLALSILLCGLIGAIVWNLATWYFGIPSSSSHALVGGLIGAAAGDKKGALIGAAVGAGVGYLAGNEIAKRKANYAREEDFLEAEIAQAEALNQEAVAYNEKLRGQISSLDTQSKQLATRYRSGQATRDQLLAQRNTVQERMKKSRDLEEGLRKEHDIKAAVAKEERGQRGGDDPYVKSLEKQVKELQTNIDNLHRGSAQLARIDERLSV